MEPVPAFVQGVLSFLYTSPYLQETIFIEQAKQNITGIMAEFVRAQIFGTTFEITSRYD